VITSLNILIFGRKPAKNNIAETCLLAKKFYCCYRSTQTFEPVKKEEIREQEEFMVIQNKIHPKF
jgi:hypothetical protein